MNSFTSSVFLDTQEPSLHKYVFKYSSVSNYQILELSNHSCQPTSKKSSNHRIIKFSNFRIFESTVTTTYSVESYFPNQSTRHLKSKRVQWKLHPVALKIP